MSNIYYFTKLFHSLEKDMGKTMLEYTVPSVMVNWFWSINLLIDIKVPWYLSTHWSIGIKVHIGQLALRYILSIGIKVPIGKLV